MLFFCKRRKKQQLPVAIHENSQASLPTTSATKMSGQGEPDKPLEELTHLLNRMKTRVEAARRSYWDGLVEAANPPPTASPKSPARSGLGRLLGRKRSGDLTTASSPTKSSNGASPSPSPVRPAEADKDKQGRQVIADFIPFPEQDEFVEDLRRAAELCVIGEHFITNLQKKEERKQQRGAQRWAAARDGMMLDSESEHTDTVEGEEDNESRGKMLLFDLFFERNGLALIVEMLSGDYFDFEKNPIKKDEDQDDELDGSMDKKSNKPDLGDKTLLPPLSIATQALQSISILIQNVSRATSLYVILSNNYINKLIRMPLDLYATAEKRRMMATKEAKALPAAFASPQMTETATHFVTFLKSLALRMNSETLQFFLKYPEVIHSAEHDGGDREELEPSIPTTPKKKLADHSVIDNVPKVEFPLYERALEFCGAHHDSFVRTTAMNICMNTLRLTTIAGDDSDDPDELGLSTASSRMRGAASPDGVLHNAKPLPFRERLVIAQYACIPSRVEHLISPIFTKLAERWSALDEAIRNIDTNKHMGASEVMDDLSARNERVAKAREKVRRERLIRAFKERVADLQDELLLMDDVFKVGLTVLNEQMIEMMLATLVYPLLLQPLLLYYQRLTASVDEDRFSFSDHPFGGISADLSDVDKTLLQVSGPAKSALFTLATIFKFVSNRPLLRLLHTVMLHPLSPDSSSAPTVRSKLEVASVDHNGRNCIRLDEVNFPRDELIPDERTTYAFGTSLTNRRRSSKDLASNGEEGDTEACVFVLAPALAEILEYRGQDMALIARTRPNPYRKALLKCLTVPEDMADIRELAICTFDAVLSVFDGNFDKAILFGTDLKAFADDIPADERNLDSLYAHAEDNRGLGGSVELDSRHSLGSQRGGSVGSDLVGEVVSALCSCVVFSSRLPSNEWKLGYDEIAAHTLLTSIRFHPGAIIAASKLLEKKWRQAAILLADVPLGLNPMGGSPFTLTGAPSINDPHYEQVIFEAFLNIVFYDSLDLGGTPTTEELLQLKEVADTGSRDGYAVTVSCDCNLQMLSDRVGKFLLSEGLDAGLGSFDKEMVEGRREGARCWFKLDALLSLLKDLGATAGLSVRDISLAGIAFGAKGSAVKLDEGFDARSIYANISPETNDCLFSKHSDSMQPEPQSFVDLVGIPAIPCVIEAAEIFADLFTDEVSGVVAEGVTWQSLYLVFVGHFLVFAVPLPDGTATVGRVITSCNLERITLEYDTTVPEDGSAARRISLNYKWFDRDPPPLFLFDEMPDYEDHGPFVRIRSFTSRLDVWFENERAASYGYGELSSQIFMAKAHRGRLLQAFLDPNAENSPSPW